MKLLFGQNISHRLVDDVSDIFPGSDHVRNHDLSRANDAEIWAFAKAEGFVLVSKDEDFHQRSFVEGHPPKVIWVRLGNCTTRQIAQLLHSRSAETIAFLENQEESFLILSG